MLWFCWFHIVSIQKEKFAGAPCMPTLSSCSGAPSCSMLFLFDLSCLHFAVGHGICIENNRVWLDHTDRQIPGYPSNPCHRYGLGQGYKLATHTRTCRHPWHQPARVHKPVTFPSKVYCLALEAYPCMGCSTPGFWKTLTHTCYTLGCGYGFSGVWMQVALETPVLVPMPIPTWLTFWPSSK